MDVELVVVRSPSGDAADADGILLGDL